MSDGRMRTVAGTLDGGGGALSIGPFGLPLVTVEISGTFVQTLTINESINGSNFVPAQVYNAAGASVSAVISAPGRYFVEAGGRSAIQVAQTAYTSGTAAIVMTASFGEIGAGTAAATTASIADGADVCEGATTDAANTTGAAGTISGKLRGILTILADVWNSSVHFLKVGGPNAVGTPPGTNPVSVAGYDGTNKQHLLTDTSGRSIVVGAAAAGSALAGNSVRVGMSDGTNQQDLRCATGSFAGIANTQVLGVGIHMVASANTWTPFASLAGSSADSNGGANAMGAGIYAYNGGSYDRVRNNVDATLLSSAARTTTQTSADIVAYNCRGVEVTLDVTAIVSTCSLTVTINYKDPASGKYVQLLAGATVSSVSTNRYRVYPSLTAVANLAANDLLGRTFQIVVTAGNANSQTYSVGYTLIP